MKRSKLERMWLALHLNEQRTVLRPPYTIVYLKWQGAEADRVIEGWGIAKYNPNSMKEMGLEWDTKLAVTIAIGRAFKDLARQLTPEERSMMDGYIAQLEQAPKKDLEKSTKRFQTILLTIARAGDLA